MATVFAAHDTTVTISPDIANCGELGNEFVVTIENDASSSNDIFEVRIYKGTAGTADFSCGLAPIGWALYDFTDEYGYCEYKTQQITAGNRILPGTSQDFIFTATMEPLSCASSFLISTLDNAQPVGEHEFKQPAVKIDCTPPEVQKTVNLPKILMDDQCNSETEICDYWITQDTVIDVYGSDSIKFDECNLGLDKCEWRYSLDGGAFTQWMPYYDEGDISFDFSFKEDSEHLIEIQCTDIAGNTTTITETDKVDSTPPESNKYFTGPQKIEDGVEWIDGISTVVIESADPDPTGFSCNIGEVKTYYNLSRPVDDFYCYNSCAEWQTGTPNASGDGWNEYTAPLAGIEESCHVLEYYSVDKIGNIEEVKTNCFFVDKTPPLVEKTVGKPQFICDDGENCHYYITSETPITLTCEDQLPHPSGDVVLSWRYRVDEGQGFGDWTGFSQQTEKTTIYFPEQSMHELEYWCNDAVGKESEHFSEIDKVDNEAPIITKTISGDYEGICPPGEGDDCYILPFKTEIHVNAEDVQSIHAVNNVSCKWGYTYQNEFFGWNYPELNDWTVVFEEDSTHDLTIVCWDGLGNEIEDTERFLVDGNPPETTKTYIGPQYPDPIVEGQTPYPHWISVQTTVNLSAEDEKVGVDQTYYRVTQVDDIYCLTYGSGDCVTAQGEGEFVTYNNPFTMEESCHFIEFYSVDKLGNTETTKSQCVFVDDTPPTIDKIVGDPNVPCEGDECHYFITQQTPITFICTDIEPHPVGGTVLNYRYRLSNDCVNWNEWTDWNTPLITDTVKTTVIPGTTIYFPEDSCHEIEYYCEDALGNSTNHSTEIDVVDSVGPTITKTVEGPQVGDCPPEGDEICIIDGVTKIHVDAVDPTPHPVEGVLCNWDYEVIGGEKLGRGEIEVIPPFVINFPEESQHELTIVCYDALGNTTRDIETFYVDKTPPVIKKWFGEPYFEEQGLEWITTATPIYAAAVDPEPHPSGLATLEYRVSLVEDEACRDIELCSLTDGDGDWTKYDEEGFYAGEESCHLIEIKATDNVDKFAVHKQCVFVDETAPETVKTVGEPNDLWDGMDSAYYPEIKDLCWNGQGDEIECWKVTLLTPITMACNDPLPHPVDHETIYFQVELDADDTTENYCMQYNGTMTDNGWCHVEQKEVQFYFLEETEHNLKYYCEDALGNISTIDDEKFKVEGTTFKIELNKKWNLVSVPFVLINDNIEDVFSDVMDNIESVWTYDAFTDSWYVYHPGNPGISNLEHVMPGWGYWIRTYEADTLLLGGSLFSPATTPPSRDLKDGWNLIGHYGLQGQTVYDGPNLFAEGRQAGCSLYSLGTSVLDKGWTSLLTYWETDNPNQWKELNYYNYMNPGAGYWISSSGNNKYEYTTTCSGLIVA